MKIGHATVALALMPALLLGAASGFAADAAAGKGAFRQQCALCHSAEPNDNGGAQGPELHGVFGAKAASNSAFSYTKPLKDSNLTWDVPTLDRFLTSPTTVVPGSTMVIPVPKADDRANIIAYFQALKDGSYKDPPRPTFGGFPPGPPPAANTGPPKGEQDWKKDAPGRRHRIDVAKLPAPYDTPGARNFPRFIEKPADAKIQLPAGFTATVFASGLQGPRNMRIAPNGDIILAETSSGRIKVLRPSADGTKAEQTEVFAQGLVQPYGIQLYPSGARPQWLYVAEVNRVVRYAYKVGDTKASGVPEVVVAQLSPVGGGHFTRDLVFSPNGKRMYIAVGSESNFAEDMSKKTPEQVKAWEATRAVGAAWDKEENRAAVLEYEVGSNKPGKFYATGIRNCVGLTLQPATGDLWCTTNERDMLGDDLVPDYSTRVKKGGFYGWPWYYMGNNEEPRLKGERPDLAGKTIVPDVPFTAHSAAVNLVFYPQNSGKSAFPREYVGEGFAVLHGSWNRAFRTGHKIVRVLMKKGVPTGEYEDFMVGFIADDGNAWARPVGAAVAQDGSLLISDDGANLIYRIAYAR